MSKLSDFLSKSKIDSRRLLSASKGIESFGPEDRAIVLARRNAKGASATDAIKEAAKTKKRSGRPVGAPTLNAGAPRRKDLSARSPAHHPRREPGSHAEEARRRHLEGPVLGSSVSAGRSGA
jgi:hypothetical protein